MRVGSFQMNLTRRTKIFIVLFIIFILLEVIFDIIEIGIGMVMLWTNDYRPKIGRLWNEEEKDEIGQSKVNSLLDSLSQIPNVYRKIKNLQDLRDYLAYKSQMQISREEFITLYRSFPAHEAARLLDADLLFDLNQNSDWQSVRLSYADDKLAMLFLDSFGQPIWDAHAFIGDLTYLDDQGQLQKDEQFQGRIVTGKVFSLAYESLDNNLRLQIINDPRLYQSWRNRLLQVGIGGRVRDGSVDIAFEVLKGGGTEIFKLQASELAVGYLIEAINSIAPSDQILSAPVKEE